MHAHSYVINIPGSLAPPPASCQEYAHGSGIEQSVATTCQHEGAKAEVYTVLAIVLWLPVYTRTMALLCELQL
jgi:hypothetical protein